LIGYVTGVQVFLLIAAPRALPINEAIEQLPGEWWVKASARELETS